MLDVMAFVLVEDWVMAVAVDEVVWEDRGRRDVIEASELCRFVEVEEMIEDGAVAVVDIVADIVVDIVVLGSLEAIGEVDAEFAVVESVGGEADTPVGEALGELNPPYTQPDPSGMEGP